MFSRLTQFRMALFMAVGFVVIRLSYAVIFGGAKTPGQRLIEIPEVQLFGPFRHISLFGEVTLQGLIANLQTAVPFAILILSFGVLASLISPSKLLHMAPRARYGRKLLMALAIGWAQLPALVESVRRIRFALKLRGEKSKSAFIPILETAASKALAIATRISIEQGKSVPKPIIEVKNLVVGNNLIGDLTVNPGQLIVITGATGSGKTSLLLALTGLASELGYVTQGTVHTFGSLGYLPQNPRDSIWGPLVRDELDVDSKTALSGKSKLEVQYLSEGEAVRLVLDRELRRNPQILLLDEPFAALDTWGSDQLVLDLKRHLQSGGIAIVIEHQIEALVALQPNWLQLDEGQLKPGIYHPRMQTLNRLPAVVGSDLVFEKSISEISVSNRTLLKDVELAIHQGQAISISGPNGSGKTSLLKHLVLNSKPRDLAMVPELVSDFFVTQTLRDELNRADRLSGHPRGFTKATFDSICPDLEVDLEIHPRDLSFGTQLALAISMQLNHKPKVLLIDEPVKGFDSLTKERVAETLRCVLETGTAIIFATHDNDFAGALAHTHLQISGGKLAQVAEVSR